MNNTVKKFRSAALIFAAILLAGCGNRVPEKKDPVFSGVMLQMGEGKVSTLEHSSALDNAAAAYLESENPEDLVFILQGYTSPTGSLEANRRIAAKRCDAVKSALLSRVGSTAKVVVVADPNPTSIDGERGVMIKLVTTEEASAFEKRNKEVLSVIKPATKSTKSAPVKKAKARVNKAVKTAKDATAKAVEVVKEGAEAVTSATTSDSSKAADE